MKEIPYLNAIARQMQYGSGKGYGTLILSYTDFLKKKLNFHSLNPEFSGTLDYEEFISLDKVRAPDEGLVSSDSAFSNPCNVH